MNRLRPVIAALALVVCLPALAFAQAKKGDREFLVFANFNSIVGGGAGANGSGNIFFNVGKFFTASNELGGGPSITIAAGSGGGFNATVGANGFFRHYMQQKNPRIAPYFGGEASVLDFGNFKTSFYIAGVGGLKDYLSEKAAIDIKASVGFNPSSASTWLIAVTAGLTYVF